MANLDVVALHRGMGIAILTDGQKVPVTNWVGADGYACDASDAVTCVCGPDQDDNWYAVELAKFMETVTQ